MSLVTVLATQAEGRTLVHDWLYELRLFALEQMSGMSADLFLCDPHRIIVTGPRRLRGRPLDSRDLRSGMALIAAALAADGQSRLSPLETVERGYAQTRRSAAAAGREGAKSSVERRLQGRRARARAGGEFARRTVLIVTNSLNSLRARGGSACGWRSAPRREAPAEAAGRRAAVVVPAGPARWPRRHGRQVPVEAADRVPAATDANGEIESRPTRNARRSASVTSSTRTMCGVSVRMMSV